MGQFKASIWIHQYYQTKDPLSVELTSVSGEGIDFDFLRYMDEHADDSYVIGRFAALKTETAYNVLGHYWYEDNEFDFQIDSFVEIIVDDEEVDEIVANAVRIAMGQSRRIVELEAQLAQAIKTGGVPF